MKQRAHHIYAFHLVLHLQYNNLANWNKLKDTIFHNNSIVALGLQLLYMYFCVKGKAPSYPYQTESPS